VLLAACGAASILLALRCFGEAGTAPEPWKPTTALATGGIYRLTRNPMYLGMALLLGGLGLGLASWGVMAMLPLVLLIVDRFVIQREERYLDVRFGAPYSAYRNEVRRWL
jgi:protein-S-isoprenylcysteine O-methyltransferase Ste14